MRRSRTASDGVASAGVFLAIFLAAAPSFGGTVTDEDKAKARALMDQGVEARGRGDHASELRAFQEADAIMHVPTTTIEVGKALTATGQWTEALEAFQRAVDSPVVPGEFPAQKEARKTAAELGRVLERNLPQVTVRLEGLLAPPAEPRIEIDQRPVLARDLAKPVRLDPGPHLFRATLADGRSAEVTTTLAAGEARSVALVVQDSQGSEPPPPRPDETTWKIVTYSGIGLVVVGAGIGTVAGIVSLGQTSDAKAQCDGTRCPPSAAGDIDSARTMATVSTIGFVGAGVGVVAAAVGYFVLRPKGRPAAVLPSFRVGGAGIEGSF